MKRKIFVLAILSILVFEATSQPNIRYWDRASYFKISGGTVSPGRDFSDASENGLFAKNGFQFGLDYNYMIVAGFGLGINLEYDHFHFNKEAFMDYANPEIMMISGGYASTKFGLNALFNVPVEVVKDAFAINFYVEGNAGIRGMSIPSIDLEYNEIVNHYVEVSYRPRSSTMGYLGYSGGVQLLFNNRFGINVSYNALIERRNNINYSVRMFDAQGELYEEESYLNKNLDHTGLQFGILFMFGKR
ncbi:MAG: hypothetical protein ACOCWC_00795 [Bacteroidota bacterium]